MTRTFRRPLAITATGLMLAVVMGAGSALAAPAAPATTAGPAPAAAGTVRCAALWVTAKAHPTVANLQAVGRCEIDRRLETLARLQSAVSASQTLTDDHQAALGQILASATSGLQALRTEIDGDTSVDAVREDVRRIFEDYRVYALVSRQVALVTAVDTVGVAADRSTASAEDLEAAIDEAEANGKDVGDARTHLATMTASIDTAKSAVDGTAAAVLALTPAAWNAGDAQPVLRDARESVKDARAALRKALAAARAILVDLR